MAEKTIEIDDLVFGEDIQLKDSTVKNQPPESKEQIVTPTNVKKINTNVTNEKTIEVDDEFLESNDEEEIEEEITPSKTSKVKEEESSDENPLSVFAKQFKEQGFLETIEDLPEIESFDDLASLLSSDMNNAYKQWQDEYKQDMINNLIKEGLINSDNVSKGKIFTKKDLESESKAKDFLIERYKEKGFKDKQIEKMIDKSLDLTEDALDMFDDYEAEYGKKEKDTLAKIEREKAESRKRQEEFDKALNQSFNSFTEFLPGKKINKKTQEKLLDKLPETFQKINSNLVKYAPIITYLDELGVFDGKLDGILNAGESKATDKLSQILKAKKPSTSNYTKEDTDDDERIRRAAFNSLKKK